MKIILYVKLNKLKEGVEKISDSEFVVYTKKLAVENKANEDIIRQIAKYFKVAKSGMSIVRGMISKIKTIEIKTQK